MNIIPYHHRYSKEGYKNQFFDNEKEMLHFLSSYENLSGEYDLPNVEAFLKTLGINSNYKVVVLSTESYQEAVKNVPPHLPLNPNSLGEVQSRSRVIVMNQKLSLENENGGRFFTQALIAHEIAHRDSYTYFLTNYIENTANVHCKRDGFAIYDSKKQKIQNAVLEEGFAALVQEKYLVNNWDNYPVSKQFPNPNIRPLALTSTFVYTPSFIRLFSVLPLIISKSTS